MWEMAKINVLSELEEDNVISKHLIEKFCIMKLIFTKEFSEKCSRNNITQSSNSVIFIFKIFLF